MRMYVSRYIQFMQARVYRSPTCRRALGMPSKGRELRYHSGKKRFVLGSYDEADHPLVLAEFDKARERFFDDEEFWRYDMRYKLAVQKRLPLPAPFVRKIQSRHKGVS